jgi:Lon protease-like protein
MLGFRYNRSSFATGAAAATLVGLVVALVVLVRLGGGAALLLPTAAAAFLHPAAASINICHHTRRPTKAAAAAAAATNESGRGCGVSVGREKFYAWSLRVASFEIDGEEDNPVATSLEMAERRLQSAYGTGIYDPIQDDATSALRRLAIFPLRKSVRLPTETLTLNLYESRYLALAERVLQLPKRVENDGNDKRIGAVVTSSVPSSSSPSPSGTTPAQAESRGLFGALYAGSCPQIVPANRQSSGGAAPSLPVTPLVQPGDVGVLFGVESYQDANVPTLGSVPRRRIRLVARGRARFRVVRVVEKGYRSDSATPYIVVEARVLKDAPLPDFGNEASEFERRMRSACLKLFGMPPDANLASNQLMFPSSKSGSIDWTTQSRELASFAVASKAMELAGTAQDVAARTQLLRLVDPLERLRWVVR